MTLLFFDGFENADTVQKPEWDTAASFSVVSGRNGNAAAFSANVVKTLTLPTPAATLTCGMAVNPRPSGTGVVFGVTGVAAIALSLRASGSASDNLTINYDSTGHLVVRLGAGNGTVIATGSYALPLSTWTHLQVRATLSAVAANGYLEVRINGSTAPDILLTGVATSTVTGAVASMRVSNISTSNAQLHWYDDLWVCDAVDATATQGRPNNGFLGDLKVVSLLPTGAGASTQWTPNTAVANYTTVDEATPNTTDYVSASTAALRDLYDVADLPTTTPIAQVLAVRAGLYAQKSDAGAASVRALIRQGNGTVNQGPVVGLGTTFGPAYGSMLAAKADGTVWSVADVNAAQVGAESA